MRVLVTGGAGYIGSHILIELLNRGYEVVLYDNFITGSMEILEAVEIVTRQKFEIERGDVRDLARLRDVFQKHSPEAVIHLAGLKSLSDSVIKPLEYYDVNLIGTWCVLKAMEEYGCSNLIFSSSATVYGIAQYLPIDEEHPLNPMNPYAVSKYSAEQMIKGWSEAREINKAVCLRYFNPIGAHPSGLVGEVTKNHSQNLMPHVLRAASNGEASLNIYGNDYGTRDGTCERDFIHICDLSVAHVKTLSSFSNLDHFDVLNIGTGLSTTVFELVNAFKEVNNVEIKIAVRGRRKGDVEASYTNVEKANKKINFHANFGLKEMCRDAWCWNLQSKNVIGD